MINVIFVCQVFYPDPQATSQLFSDLFAGLAAQGWRCEVLAGFPIEEAARRDCARDEMWNDVHIRRGGCRINFKRNFLFRAIGYSTYCAWLIWQLVVKTPKGACVLVTTNPPFVPILAHWCSRVRKWSYDVFLLDIFPDGLVALGHLKKEAWLTKAWRGLNRRALAAARKVMVLGRDMSELCAERYNVPPAKISYIPHWSPMQVLTQTSASGTKLWEKLKLGDHFVVQYSGNMGLWHDIETIVKAAAVLKDRKSIRFLMIGDGVRKASAENLSKKLNLSNILWLPFQPKEELNDSLACCHVALISQRQGLEGVAVPCKLYGILASARAIIGQVPASSEVARVLVEENCGVTVKPNNSEELAEHILRLSENRALVKAMGERAFDAYRMKYTLNVAVDSFQQVLKK